MMRVLGGVALAVFILLPLVQAVLLSFTVTLEKDGVAAGAVGLMNYADVLAAPELRAAMVNSAVYVCLNVALCIGVGLPAAYALARFRFLGDRHFLLAMLVFRMTPPVVLSLPIFILFSKLGLVNSPLGIALVHCLFNLPITIWILESFIRAVPSAGHRGGGVFLFHLQLGRGGVRPHPNRDGGQADHHGDQCDVHLPDRYRDGDGDDLPVTCAGGGDDLAGAQPSGARVYLARLRSGGRITAER